MAGKKYSDIYKASNTTIVSNSDIFILERSDGNTYGISGYSLYMNTGNNIKGPYANDVIASAANVPLNQLYYTSEGIIKIRLV